MARSELNDSDNGYHEFCGYCTNECEYVSSASSYLLITNIWNEEKNISKIFHRISRQTKKPKVWLWLDDGSNDRSCEFIESKKTELPEVEVWLERLPTKKVGNLDSIGKAYDRALPPLIKRIDALGIDYIAIIDVDNNPCPNYCARLTWLLDRNPHIGAAAGILPGEIRKRHVGLPMGGGKIVRWSVVRHITKYWDIAPDTLFNIKALSMGYELKTFPVPLLVDRYTTAFSKKGVFRQGRLNYYVGRPFWGVFFRALRRVLLRQYGFEMMRGYLYERRKGGWRFNDPDVEAFYSRGRNPITALLEMLSFVGVDE